MSEQGLKERQGLGVSDGEDKEQEESEGLAGEQEGTDEEDAARSNGWLPLDEWVEAGNEVKDWADFGAFNKNGSLFRRINDLEASHDTFDMRLKNLNRMREVEKNQLLQELGKQKEDLVKDGDVDGVKKIDQQIKATEDSGGDDSMLLAEWNDQNPWIFDSADQKTSFAKNAFALALNNKLSVSDAIAEVDGKLAKRFPDKDVNQRRNDPSTSGGGKKAGKKGRALTVHDLTREEQKILDNPAFAQFSDEERMQMVKDSRAE